MDSTVPMFPTAAEIATKHGLTGEQSTILQEAIVLSLGTVSSISNSCEIEEFDELNTRLDQVLVKMDPATKNVYFVWVDSFVLHMKRKLSAQV